MTRLNTISVAVFVRFIFRMCVYQYREPFVRDGEDPYFIEKMNKKERLSSEKKDKLIKNGVSVSPRYPLVD